MHDYMEFCLFKYFETCGLNQENLYTNLCRSSTDILDFRIPVGFNANLSSQPNFQNKLNISGSNTFSKLSSSLGYIYTNQPLSIPPTSFVYYNQLADKLSQLKKSFKNEKVDKPSNLPDYLLYGNISLPKGRLEALFTKKILNDVQLIISGITSITDPDKSYSYFLLQHEIKKWCTEYSFTSDDRLFGIRTLYKINTPEMNLEKGWDPLWSAGGEFYYSAATKIGGVSFGLRRFHFFPTPTDMTMTFNPVMGHITLAYTNMLNSQLTTSTRYYFNANSLESDYALGLEWRNKSEGLIKAKYSLSKGFSVLFSGRYRQLHYTLGLNIASPTSENKNRLLTPDTMLRTMGFQLHYFSE